MALPAGGSSPAAAIPAAPALGPAGERLAYLDNLKAFLIAGIIAAHAFMGYSTWGSWTYQDIQEVTISEVTETIFVVASVALGGMFLMGLFFLLSGLMTQDSLARKGPRRFVIDRLLRLGIPFALYTLVLWPVLRVGPPRSPPPPRSLLGLVHRRRPDPRQRPAVVRRGAARVLPDSGGLAPLPAAGLAGLADTALRPRHLAAAALAVSVATFLVRIALPVDSNQPLNSHLWAWPEYVALFALGVIAARRGWLRPVPQDISRPAGITTLVAIVLLGAMVLSTDPLGLTEEDWLGGWGLPALAAALLEGVIVIAAPVWVLSFAQRRLNGTGPSAGLWPGAPTPRSCCKGR